MMSGPTRPLLAACVAFGCRKRAPEPERPPPSEVTTTAASATSSAPPDRVVALPKPSRPHCNLGLPLVVRVSNQTTAHGDLCAAFARAFANVGQAAALGPPGLFELQVTLGALTFSNTPKCRLSMMLYVNGAALSSASAAATVSAPTPQAPGTDRERARDCVDAVMGNLLASKILPVMNQHLASAPAGQPRSGGGPMPSGPAPRNP